MHRPNSQPTALVHDRDAIYDVVDRAEARGSDGEVMKRTTGVVLVVVVNVRLTAFVAQEVHCRFGSVTDRDRSLVLPGVG